MRLAVLGATGRTGRPLVEQALASGHAVTALARSPEAFAPSHPNLTVLQGDATNADDVARVVEGADAVLLTLGHTKTSSGDILAVAAEHVVSAMRRHGVHRVITETGAGVADPKDPSGLAPTLVRGVMRIVAGGLLRDSERHVEVFRESGLDWTAVRAPRLTNGPRTGNYQTGFFAMGPGESVSRADVADYMLRLAQTDEASGEAPMIKGA